MYLIQVNSEPFWSESNEVWGLAKANEASKGLLSQLESVHEKMLLVCGRSEKVEEVQQEVTGLKVQLSNCYQEVKRT